MTSNGLNIDPHNNTDDSYLTTVSIVDDSFHSAVTYLDENGDTLRSDRNSDCFDLSQKLSDSCNETLSTSEMGLDSTMLKNLSSLSNEIHRSPLQKEKKCISDTITCENSTTEDISNKNNNTMAVDANQPFIDGTKANKNVKNNDSNPSPVNLSNGEVKEAEVKTLKLEESDSANEEMVKERFCQSPRHSDDLMKEPTLKDRKTSDKSNGEVEAQKNEIEAETCEETIAASDSISTTTIILGENNSDLDVMSLEKFDSESFLTNKVLCYEKAFQDVNIMKNKAKVELENICNKKSPGGEQKKIKEEESSPSKFNKLNKSFGSGVRKSLKTPKGKKNNQKQSTDSFMVDTSKDGIPLKKTHALEASNKENLKDINPNIIHQNEVFSCAEGSNLLKSQESYTVLNSVDTNLKRPVITSNNDVFNSSKSTSRETTPLQNKKIDKEENSFGNDPSGEFAELPLKALNKASTPVSDKNFEKNACEKDQLKLLKGASGSSNINDKVTKNLNFHVDNTFFCAAPLNEHKLEFSPVTPVKDECFNFSQSSAKKGGTSPSFQVSPDLNGTWVKPNESIEKKDLNQTYEKKVGISSKLNQTFEKTNSSFENNRLNHTFDVHSVSPEPIINQTFDKKSEKEIGNPLNLTFDKKPDPHNKTFDKEKISPTAALLNKTYDKNSLSPINNLNDEDGRMSEHRLSNQQEITRIVKEEKISLGTVMEEEPIIPRDPGDVSLEKVSLDIKDSLNSSFISTTSSNTSLLCSGNTTVVFNPIHFETEDNKIINIKNEGTSENVCDPLPTENISFSKDIPFVKEEKFQCDPALVQLIQEQFSSVEMEKIFNVVDDMSSQMLKANEEFEKSFQPGAFNGEFKVPFGEDPQKNVNVNPLSPQSFDFLGSINGKSTGRDFSRESLYVKFDPLIQPVMANSLIDFTKEAVILPSDEESPRESLGETCTNLLNISPQKKTDNVPPLTPLCNKKKIKNDEENKIEKIKELQNEIYFLKNLYTERERTNKVKMDDYESQIVKLTGESCILEDKLKESNEREKSLVKKLKEQTQGTEQLKVIMEEYVKVISRLTLDLETLKQESKAQLETLSAEKDSYMNHLQNTEAAFTDVHAKYEKSKKTIINLKANEAMFRNTISEQSQKIDEFMDALKEAQENSSKQYQKALDELQEMKANQGHEILRLKAQLRRTELKLESVQETLEQKVKENQKLTAMCDELIGKK